MAKPPQPDPRQIKAFQALQQAVEQQRMGHASEADAQFARVVKKFPGYFDALNLYGVFKLQRGQPQEALKLLRNAVALNPRSANALNNFGIALGTLQRDQEALAAFERALAIDPNNARAHGNRANVLMGLGRTDEALAGFERAIALDPANPDYHGNRGRVLFELARHEEALASYDRALSLAPPKSETLINRGSTLQALGRHEQALDCFGQAIALNPENATAYNNAGFILQHLGRDEEALVAYSQALELKPDFDLARWQRSTLNLNLGRLAEGWADFGSRLGAFPEQRQRPYPQPLWNGMPLHGTLLAWADAGIGDEILCAGMVPDLQTRADAVVLEVDTRLVPLLARSMPGIEVVARGPLPYPGPVTAQTALSNLGPYLRRRWEDFPKRNGYLVADTERIAELRRRLAGDGAFVIGLSWSSKNARYGAAKSLSLADLVAVIPQRGCRLVDLQYGDTAAERAEVESTSGVRVERLHDIDNLRDIDGLAALISACDLVLTVSNTTAHLAGALGRPGFVLMSRGPAQFWYWFGQGDDSPWYPSLRLFRQSKPGEWDAALTRVRDALERIVDEQPGRPA